jgi:hypothetical protein
MLFALGIVKTPMNGAPTVPPSVKLPAPAVKVRSKSPATVLERVRAPPPELRAMAWVMVIGEAKERVPVVLTSEPSVTVPAPVCVKLVLEVTGAVEPMVNVPLFVIAIDPPCDVTALLKLIATPLILMDVASRVPLMVVVPVDESIEKGPEWTIPELMRTLFALTISNPAGGVVCPTALEKVTFPVPAVSWSVKAPSMVPERVIFPGPDPVFIEEAAVSCIAEAKLTASFVVVIELPKWTGPAPV